MEGEGLYYQEHPFLFHIHSVVPMLRTKDSRQRKQRLSTVLILEGTSIATCGDRAGHNAVDTKGDESASRLGELGMASGWVVT